jgi:predicted membrane protein
MAQNKLSNSVWVGIIILGIGSFLLIKKLDIVDFPDWVFSFGSLLVAIGLLIGAQSRFKGIGWLILLTIGTFFILDDVESLPFNFRRYSFPIGVIVVGAFVLGRALLGPKSDVQQKAWGNQGAGFVMNDEGGEDHFDMTTVFGGTKQKIFSKAFKGGQTTCIFGGSEIDLSQADIEGTVIIDVVQIFGGAKLIMPANWQLKSDVTAILGSVEDKRMVPPSYTPEKKIVLTGFVLFGGVEIKSY